TAIPAVRDSRPRSPLRAGTALEGPVPCRPHVNSLLDRGELQQVGAPVHPSKDFTCCRGFERHLSKAAQAVASCDTLELGAIARAAITQLHRPAVKEISNRKLPAHIPNDPIDPAVIFVKAIPLAHR